MQFIKYTSLNVHPKIPSFNLWKNIVNRFILEYFFFEHGLSNWFCNYICIEIMKCWIVSSSPTSWKIWKLISILSKGDVINSWSLFHCGSANVSSKIIIFNFTKSNINQMCKTDRKLIFDLKLNLVKKW